MQGYNSKRFALKTDNEDRTGLARYIHRVPDMRFTALCGARPGYLYNGWELISGDIATCPECRRKEKAIEKQANQGGQS